VEIIESFDKWKEFLHGKVLLAEKIGFSDTTIAKGVDWMQNFLSKIIEPQNPEERLLHQLWELGNSEERQALSNLVLKLVKAEDQENPPGAEDMIRQ
jgi:hypothetical protein